MRSSYSSDENIDCHSRCVKPLDCVLFSFVILPLAIGSFLYKSIFENLTSIKESPLKNSETSMCLFAPQCLMLQVEDS